MKPTINTQQKKKKWGKKSKRRGEERKQQCFNYLFNRVFFATQNVQRKKEKIH